MNKVSERTVFLLIASKTNNSNNIKKKNYLKQWHAFGRSKIDLVQPEHVDLNYLTLHFDTSLIDFDLDSGSHECKKAKTFHASFQSILMEFGIPLRLAGVMNSVLVLFRAFSMQRRQPYLCHFIEKNILGFYSGIH